MCEYSYLIGGLLTLIMPQLSLDGVNVALISAVMPALCGNEILALHTKWMKVIRESNEHESIFNGALIKYILPHNFLRQKCSPLNFPKQTTSSALIT